MERTVTDFISQNLVRDPSMLPLNGGTRLIETGILDSLSMLKLTAFLEEEFNVSVKPEDIIPEHFATVNATCAFISATLSANHPAGR